MRRVVTTGIGAARLPFAWAPGRPRAMRPAQGIARMMRGLRPVAPAPSSRVSKAARRAGTDTRPAHGAPGKTQAP